jgi:hypothetical protein
VRVTVKKQDRRPRTAVLYPELGLADVDPLQREPFEYDPPLPRGFCANHSDRGYRG